MKKILVIIMLVFAFGCSDDGTNPVETNLVGKWYKDFTIIKDGSNESIQVLLILEFFNNGTFKMINEEPEEEIVNDHGTYTLSNDVLTIVNSKCDNIEGKYKFEFEFNSVQFTRIEDECINNNIIIGYFENWNTPVE